MSQTTEEQKPIDVKAAQAIDGFQNLTSKVGATPGSNNQLSNSSYVFNYITRNRILLEAMYRGSWTAGKIIDVIAEDMTRDGIEITTSTEPENVVKMQTAISKLRIWDSMRDLKKWARLYGGAVGVLLIEGQDLSTPLDIDRIMPGQFKGIKPFDRWQVYPNLAKSITSGPDMGLPAYYTLILTAGQTSINVDDIEQMKTQFGYMDGMEIHHSRIIRQIGIKLPYFQAILEMMWGESELERLHDRLVAFDNASMSAANLINHANLTNVRVDKLREVVSAGGKALDGLSAMFDMMRFMRSNEGLTLVDKEDEIGNVAYSFAGLSDMLLQFAQQISGACGIPLVKLMGQSPAGLNSTGESDIRNYYDGILAQQEESFRPGVEKILKVLHKSLFGKPAPDDMQFTFNPLWQMSDDQKAEIASKNASTITSVFSSGLINRTLALKELRHQSAQTGLFTNITDEDIADAEEAEQYEMPPEPQLNEEDKKDDKKVTDAIKKWWKKLKRG